MLGGVIINQLPWTVLKNTVSLLVPWVLVEEQVLPSTDAQHLWLTLIYFLHCLLYNPISILFHCNIFLYDKERKGGKSAGHQETLSQSPVGSLLTEQSLRRAPVSSLSSRSPHLNLSRAPYPTLLSTEGQWHPCRYDSLKARPQVGHRALRVPTRHRCHTDFFTVGTASQPQNHL